MDNAEKWKHAPPWAQWLAYDKKNSWQWFAAKPSVRNHVFCSSFASSMASYEREMNDSLIMHLETKI